MASLALTTAVKRIVSAATLAMAVVVTFEMAFGYGATTAIPSIVQWTCMIAAYVMGAFWWFGPWPTLGQAFAFVVIADIAIFGATITADFEPEVTLGKCTFLIPLGMLAGPLRQVEAGRTHSTVRAGYLHRGGVHRGAPRRGHVRRCRPVGTDRVDSHRLRADIADDESVHATRVRVAGPCSIRTSAAPCSIAMRPPRARTRRAPR